MKAKTKIKPAIVLMELVMWAVFLGVMTVLFYNLMNPEPLRIAGSVLLVGFLMLFMRKMGIKKEQRKNMKMA